jgi:hypothetical protein
VRTELQFCARHGGTGISSEMGQGFIFTCVYASVTDSSEYTVEFLYDEYR